MGSIVNIVGLSIVELYSVYIFFNHSYCVKTDNKCKSVEMRINHFDLLVLLKEYVRNH